MIKLQEVHIDTDSLNKEPNCDALEIIATRNLVLFPGVTVHFELGREQARDLAKRASGAKFPVGIVCQYNPEEEKPSVTTGLYKYGVFADVLTVQEVPGASNPVAIVRGRGRFRIIGSGGSGRGDKLVARVKPLEDIEPKEGSTEFNMVMELLRQSANSIFEKTDETRQLSAEIRALKSDAEVINTLATNIPFESADKISLLSKSKLEDRAVGLVTQLDVFLDRIRLTQMIAEKAKAKMDENQRNAFLQNQMEAIRDTLYGDGDDEIDELIAKAEASCMPHDILVKFQKEADKMRRYNPSSPDYAVQFSYLDTLVSLPWIKRSETTNDLTYAAQILEDDHFGLEKVKQRIIEMLALLFHVGEQNATILCLVGPPGVGKTSIGRSIARALGRKYERVSFGGLHDESEIRGHRRTYIGAMPGRIIDAIKRAQVVNPVILLDEIDKIGADYKGDPSAALLEVLDPEQNCHFHDNYIDVDYNLSNVLFIATANTLTTIPKPLLDRMEIIDISGYLLEEKIEIARRHLIPKICNSHGIQVEDFELTDEALTAIISRYTAEAGVRELEKKIAALARKKVLADLKGESYPKPVKDSDLYSLLGLETHHHDQLDDGIPGVVTGLAWTEVGGEILMAEASLSPAKDGSLGLTGNLGNVMKESATLAYQWIKSHAEEVRVDREQLNSHTIHIHFPEGAIPKDGPSAGITITTAMVSILTGRPVRNKLAMTGEISLRGRVLPVGGIREKILAAKRAGVTDIIMSVRNRPDIDDMPEAYRKGLTFHYADTINDVLAVAF